MIHTIVIRTLVRIAAGCLAYWLLLVLSTGIAHNGILAISR